MTETRAAMRNCRTAGAAQSRGAAAIFEFAGLSGENGTAHKIAPRNAALNSQCFPTDWCRSLYLALDSPV